MKTTTTTISYLGVGRSAYLCALRYEMALPEPKSRAHIRMLRFYYRMLNMDNCRLTKKIHLYDKYLSQHTLQFSTWSNEIANIVSKTNLSDVVANKKCVKFVRKFAR